MVYDRYSIMGKSTVRTMSHGLARIKRSSADSALEIFIAYTAWWVEQMLYGLSTLRRQLDYSGLQTVHSSNCHDDR